MGERSEHPPAPLGYSIDLLFSQENLLFLFPENTGFLLL